MRTKQLATLLVLACATSAQTADAARPTSHSYKSSISVAPLATANGYPNPGGTAVLAGTLQLAHFGAGALVDRLRITGHPSPNVFTFAGTEVDYFAGGSWISKYTGTDTVLSDGTQQIAISGRFTGGTGAYRGAKGNYKFTGTAPSGSTTVTGHSTGSITY